MIWSLTVSNLDWGTLWAGQCIAAAGVFPAARNCSAYPAKFMVVMVLVADNVLGVPGCTITW